MEREGGREGASWGGRARGKQSCALPRAPPAGDPALGAAGAARSPVRCSAGTAAWGGAASKASETRAKFAALGPGPPGPPRPASAPGVRAPAASGERRAGRRMGCGLRVLRSAWGTWLQRGRGSDRHRLPQAAPPRASFLSVHLLGVSWWLSLLPACCSFICNPFSGTWWWR